MMAANQASSVRINVGCGASPTQGWLNFDGSPTVHMSRVPGLIPIARRLRLITEQQVAFSRVVQTSRIQPANAIRKLPMPNDTVEVLYTSHMIEHLTRYEVSRFLSEAYRVLRQDGIIRIAVPNLKRLVTEYLDHLDADAFVQRTLLGSDSPRNTLQRIKSLVARSNRHLWMYDEASVLRLLSGAGFVGGVGLEAGQTTISDPGSLNLREREDESLYVEARKPRRSASS